MAKLKASVTVFQIVFVAPAAFGFVVWLLATVDIRHAIGDLVLATGVLLAIRFGEHPTFTKLGWSVLAGATGAFAVLLWPAVVCIGDLAWLLVLSGSVGVAFGWRLAALATTVRPDGRCHVSLTLSLAFGGILCVVIGPQLHEFRAQRRAVVWLKEAGGRCEYCIHDAPRWLQGLFGLDCLATIRRVDLRNTRIDNISLLVYLPDLEEIDISYTNVDDLLPLGRLKKLHVLRLSGTPVTDLSPLKTLAELNRLDIAGSQVDTVSPLSRLDNLESLSVDTTQLHNLVLLELPQLTSLNLVGAELRDVSPLRRLINLRGLSLNDSDVTDLSPLETLTKLESLELSFSQVEDLSPLAGLTNLKYLDLAGTPVADISPLKNLTRLRWLYLQNTAVADLSPLSNLRELRVVALWGTRVNEDDIANFAIRAQVEKSNRPRADKDVSRGNEH